VPRGIVAAPRSGRDPCDPTTLTHLETHFVIKADISNLSDRDVGDYNCTKNDLRNDFEMDVLRYYIDTVDPHYLDRVVTGHRHSVDQSDNVRPGRHLGTIRHTEKVSSPPCSRVAEDTFRGTFLLDAPLPHDDDPVCKVQGFFLVMRDIETCETELL